MNTQYANGTTNPSGLSLEQLNNMRLRISKVAGAMIGRRICYPVSDGLDLNYGRKEKGEVPGLRLATPLKKYFVEVADITAAEVIITASDKVVIQFNKREDLQFTLSADPTEIFSAEPKDVHAAIKLFESTGQKKFFCNVQMVTDTVTALNRNNILDIEKFVDELTEQSIALENLNKIITSDADAYYKSLGQE